VADTEELDFVTLRLEELDFVWLILDEDLVIETELLDLVTLRELDELLV